METKKKSIFQRPLWVVIFALTAAIAWGWAYPLIKLGFEEFGITPQMTGSKMLFAGIRFMISGLIILAIAWNTKKNFQVKRSSDWWYILLFALLNTTIHYACFYIGLSIVTEPELPYSTPWECSCWYCWPAFSLKQTS